MASEFLFTFHVKGIIQAAIRFEDQPAAQVSL